MMASGPETRQGWRRGRLSRPIVAVLTALGLAVATALGTWLFNVAAKKATESLSEPLIVRVQDVSTSPSFVFPASVSPADAPLDPNEAFGPAFVEWARASGGIPYLMQQYKVTVWGRAATPVVITGIRVRVKGRGPLTGRWINFAGWGGDVATREMRVELGEAKPGPRLYVAGKERTLRDYDVTSTRPEHWNLTVCPGAGVTEWVLEVSYSAAGKVGTYTATDAHQEPFRLAGGGSPLVYSPALGQVASLTRDRAAEKQLRRGQLGFCRFIPGTSSHKPD